jgi:hypothetical protein
VNSVSWRWVAGGSLSVAAARTLGRPCIAKTAAVWIKGLIAQQDAALKYLAKCDIMSSGNTLSSAGTDLIL